MKTLWWVLTRTCNLACSYCAPAGTPVLMVGGAWKKIEDVRAGDRVVAFETDPDVSHRVRRFTETTVTAEIKKRGRLIRFSTSRGDIESTPDHEWLVRRGTNQKKVIAADVKITDKLYWLATPVMKDPTEDIEYKTGWLSGFILGDGSYGKNWFRVYSKDAFLIDRWEQYARLVAGVGTSRLVVTRRSGPQKGYQLYHSNVCQGEIGLAEARKRMTAIAEMVPHEQSDAFARGWLAGMFDAEGTRTGLVITQKNLKVSNMVLGCWQRFGYNASEPWWDGRGAYHVRVRGGAREVQRFASEFRPACEYKVTLAGLSTGLCEVVKIDSIEHLEGEHDVYDVTTGSTTFVIGGFLAWECYQSSNHAVPAGLQAHMKDEILQTALPWALKWGNPGGLRINLYGGEPLINFPVIERNVPIWKWAFDRNKMDIAFNITTNGTRLKGKVREFLDEYKIGVLLSIDGPKRLHDLTRVHHDGRKSWDEIDPEGLVAWRPNMELAWQLDPKTPFEPDDIDEMVAKGFKVHNYNVNWLAEWDEAAQLRLQRFFKRAGRLMHQGKLQSYWQSKLTTSLTVDAKMEQPCGTGLGMLALTPEGTLFPSQEMAFTVYEGKSPGTPEYYTVGNVYKDPVIAPADLARTADIKVSQMKAGPGHDCTDCIASSSCISGCHCRYISQGGDPSQRFQAPASYCDSTKAAMTGLLQAAAIERYVRPVDFVTAKVKREIAAEQARIPHKTVDKVAEAPTFELKRAW